MDLSSLQVVGRNVGRIAMQNSPTILTGLGVGGLITTVIMAVKATPKAMALINIEQCNREDEALKEGKGWTSDPITKMDIVRLTWKCYVPTVLMGLSTAFCVIGANTIHLRRYAALAGLYELAEAGLREYEAKVIETFGEGKERKMRDDMAQDKLNKNPVDDKSIIITGNGEVLCFDSLSSRYFKSDAETIRQAVNRFNHRLLKDLAARSLNEFYDEINLEPTDMGKEAGWEWEHGMLEIVFTSKLATNNQPCLVLEYKNGPRPI